MGLSTILGIARRGYFIPYRYAGEIEAPGRITPYTEIEALFEAHRPAFSDVIEAIAKLAPELEAIGVAPAPAPRWAQGWFPRLDGAAAYTMVRQLQPRRIVEVGSGHSTRFLTQAVADAGLATSITAIDPAPRATLNGLPIDFIPAKLHEAPSDLFENLAANDVVFVDSSHILMPGTDVDILLNRIWPLLKDGVIVHFHDIFLPDDYPMSWSWRGYNEQLGVAPLIANGAADILFASHFAATRMADALANTVLARIPLMEGAVESSLWLRKRTQP